MRAPFPPRSGARPRFSPSFCVSICSLFAGFTDGSLLLSKSHFSNSQRLEFEPCLVPGAVLLALLFRSRSIPFGRFSAAMRWCFLSGFQGPLSAGAGVRTSVRAPGGRVGTRCFPPRGAGPASDSSLASRRLHGCVPGVSFWQLIGQGVYQPLVFLELDVPGLHTRIRCRGLFLRVELAPLPRSSFRRRQKEKKDQKASPRESGNGSLTAPSG